MTIEPIRVKLTFHHEDRGCDFATFRGIDEDKGKWFNKSGNGTWYYTFPSQQLYEHSHEVTVPTIFEIYAKNSSEPFAIDSNIPELATKPYQFREEFLKDLQEKYLAQSGNVDYDEWKTTMLDCEEFKSYNGYYDNFLYDNELLREQVIEIIWFNGEQNEIVGQLYRNNQNKKEFWSFSVRHKSRYGEVNDDLLVYFIL